MEEILEIVKEVFALNETYNLGLSGSASLQLRGIDLGRPIHDIDIIYDQSILTASFNVPAGWRQLTNQTAKGVAFHKNNVNINIEFISSIGEQMEIVEGIKCGSLEKLVDAKRLYIENASRGASKHLADIEKIEAWQLAQEG